jgi:hypothetical protein
MKDEENNNNDLTIRRNDWMKGLEAAKKKPYMTKEEKEFFKDAIKVGVVPYRIFTKELFKKAFGYSLSRNAIGERMNKIKKEMIESGELKEEKGEEL